MNSIKTIARKARKITEQFDEQHPFIGEPKGLGCYCAIGSWILFQLARKEGYAPEFIEGTYLPETFHKDELNHCWIELDGIAYDITATQFGFSRKVMIRRASNRKQFVAVNKYKNINGFTLKDWNEQSPGRYMTEIQEMLQEN